MSGLKSRLASLVDPAVSDELKLKALQEVSESFDSIISSQHYVPFLESAIPKFLQYLKEGQPVFTADVLTQQIRKLVLELIHRLPSTEHLRQFVKPCLSVMFSLLEIENEENTLICLRIIIELHKQFRPQASPEVSQFLHFVKTIYSDLPKTMINLFESPEGDTKSDFSVQASMSGPSADTKSQSNILPKATSSLKVLAELPIVVVLMYQLYKQTVHTAVSEFIPLTMSTLVLQPSMQARSNPQFNKESYVDFVAVQIKFLSFLAYMVRIYQEQVASHVGGMVQGMLALLCNCPQEVPHLRRELLIATRHILATDLRKYFIKVIDQLFDEKVLIGSGWTARETIRPLAYSILADLVHHVRSQITLPHLVQAVKLFSRNVHDDSLPTSIQIMSCKLLLSLVECVRKVAEQDTSARDVLICMMDCFIEKFHTIATYHLPDIFEKCSAMDNNKDSTSTEGIQSQSQSRQSQGNSGSAAITALVTSVNECRVMVKTLVSGMKTIVWGAGSCKLPGSAAAPQHPQKVFLPKETAKFIALLKYALVALDIYRMVSTQDGLITLRKASVQTMKTIKEEKEVMENFASTFTMINLNTFKEIFQEQIEYLVERIRGNYALQVILNTFLANPTTSATFAAILLDFLLKRMESLGGGEANNADLYLKLFKLVFSSVSLFPQDNESMLKPHLHTIVKQSTQLANTAKDPYNYFLLLRALFRSIGGGSHDLLYQEFLPLLSNLLQGLNHLQSGVHKQYMKDLFVELCLTVPVRLSSLLPFLHMLMDPLVSALNGSQTLVSQGLRTLELCVDNLQPDFLYNHIQPVRAELMQSLWKTLHNKDENIAQVAYRVLGKFGGSNRKMLQAPQKLSYSESALPGSAILLSFPEYESTGVELPLDEAVRNAVNVLKSGGTSDTFYCNQAWLFLQSYLTSTISAPPGEDLQKYFTNVSFEPVDMSLARLRCISLPTCLQVTARDTFIEALLGCMVAASMPDLQKEASIFMAGIVRHMTILAVLQQCGNNNVFKQGPSSDALDVFAMIDTIAKCMCLEDRECSKVGELALGLILDTATVLIGDKDKAANLALFIVIGDKMCECCYKRVWFAKSGGCSALAYLVEKMPLKWIMNQQLIFLMALMFVLQDLTNDVSSGTLDQARNLMEHILRCCNKQLEHDSDSLRNIQQRSFHSVARFLVKEVISPNENVRKQSYKLLHLLSEVTNQSVTEIMEPHKGILADMIPPKKHLLKHQPVVTQIALMDGNTFCTSLTPRLFSIDLSIQEHKVFFQELYNLCDTDDNVLARLPCYKSVANLVPLRVHAIAALASCYYIPASDIREKIFLVLHKAITSMSKELQDAGKEAMKKFMTEHMDIELVHTALRPLLLMLADYRHLNTSLLQRLTIMISLFPNTFNEKMCDQLLAHLHRWVEHLVANVKQTRRGEPTEVPICLSIMEMLHMLPASSFKLAEPLIQLCFKAENALGMEVGSPFREPLFKFVLRFPQMTMDYFLSQLSDLGKSHLFVEFLRLKEADPLREVLYAASNKLVDGAFVFQPISGDEVSYQKHLHLRYTGIVITKVLLKHNVKWFSLPEQQLLVEHLKKIWMSQDYHNPTKTTPLQNGYMSHWDEKKQLVKCLIGYHKYHPDDVELLFHLLHVFTVAHSTSFHFLSTYITTNVNKGYTIEQQRYVFFKFVTFFHDAAFPHELKAQALQHIVIPMFTGAFENGKRDELLGGPPNPDHDSDDNIISVFINQVINPDRPLGSADPLSILLLQFSRLLVEHAAPHIHDSNNKRQGDKLRRIMTFAWPCLLPKQCVDPATKYHGLLLLAHIIAKFAIHKRIVLQVFHTLLKGYTPEARNIVRQALDILTPVVPIRMEDSNATLVHWTKKVIVEEGHSINQLVHILQLIVRHYKVYFPVRQHLVQHMVSSIQRLGFIANATIEHRKLAVDLAEVIIKWEFQRVREQQGQDDDSMDTDGGTSLDSTKKSKEHGEGSSWVIEKQHIDAVLNFLLRLACQVNDLPSPSPPGPSPGEGLSKRCVLLVKTALKPDIWPNVDIKLSWFDKLLCTVESQLPNNYGNTINVCTALDLLTFLLSVMPQGTSLNGFRHLHKGVMACITTLNMKIVRYVHGLLSRLLQLFPMESAAGFYCKHDELEMLYSNIAKFIHDGLSSYDKSSLIAPTQLQSTLITLKAVCSHDSACIDRFMNVFMKVIQKLHKEHVSNSSNPSDSAMVSDMLQLCIEMVKSRVGMMQQDYRKAFLTIITALIEKSTDLKLLRTITRIIDEWVRNKMDTPGQSTSPSLREKTILLTRLQMFLEKRFPDEAELNAMFLETVLYVYRDPVLSASELSTKLEQAFLSGLKFSQPQMRMKFFEVFDSSIHQKLYERLVYITCSQNWEHFNHHFWIKQCIELLLTVANYDMALTPSPKMPHLPPISSNSIGTIPGTSGQMSALFCKLSTLPPEELIEGVDTSDQLDCSPVSKEDLLTKHGHFLDSVRQAKCDQLIKSYVQLCHNSTDLARSTWIQVFPRLWAILTDRQRQSLSNELVPFLSSGAHVFQGDCHPSAIETFLEGVALCNPSVHLRACVIKYLSKSHNAWHRGVLMLENKVIANGDLEQLPKAIPKYGVDSNEYVQDPPKYEALESLAELYSSLKEDDYWTGMWTLRSRFLETKQGVLFESQGEFEKARKSYEKAMSEAMELQKEGSIPSALLPEYNVWETHWVKCAQELGNWEAVVEFGKTVGNDPFHIVDNAWRYADWTAMKEGLAQAELVCPEHLFPKLQVYKGYVAICPVEEQHLSMVEKFLENANVSVIRQWKRLPHLVSNTHVPLLQLSQVIIELQEGTQVQNILQPSQIGRPSAMSELRTIFKTWKNRLPVGCDSLSHWNDILWWRQIHFKAISRAFENNPLADQAVHHSASSTLQFAGIARKHSSLDLALNTISKVSNAHNLHPMDMFLKIKHSIKTFVKLSASMSPTDEQKALDIIKNTNLKYFSKEQISQFYALSGVLYTYLGKSEDANKSFSSAVQLCDNLAKVWGSWADYLDLLFRQEKLPSIALSLLVCCLHACRNQGEAKYRKYIARILWLLMYDDEQNTLSDTLEKNFHAIPTSHWLPWIPQLLTDIVKKSEGVLPLLLCIGKTHPQAIYFPIRTLYLTLKMEQKEKLRCESVSAPATPSKVYPIPSSLPGISVAGQQGSVTTEKMDTSSTPQHSLDSTKSASSSSQPGPSTTSEGSEATSTHRTAPAPMVRCSRIMHYLRDYHPTLLSALEGIVDQMVCFKENWSEEVLHLLMDALKGCYETAFKTRADVAGAKVTAEIESDIARLTGMFGSSHEQNGALGSQLDQQSRKTMNMPPQDQSFQRMKMQFISDFDFNSPGVTKLQNVISKLKKWIKIFEMKTKALPRFVLMDERCRFLSNFSVATGDVDIPGDYLLPKHLPYMVHIAKFMPHVEIVRRHNVAIRRLFIRGDNGKIYPYLVVNDSNSAECRREERVLQLLRMMNYFLEKNKETGRRHLLYQVPSVVAVSPQLRLVEDNTSNISLTEIFQKFAQERGIDSDCHIAVYYDKLAQIQSHDNALTPLILQQVFTEVQNNFIPNTVVQDWALQTYPNATDFWTFRKQVTNQLSLAGLVEFILHFTRLDPDMFNITRDTGSLTQTYSKFDINSAGQLDANRPVPLRLTSGLQTFIGPFSKQGPFKLNMIAVCRCLVDPKFNFAGLLRAILRDEYMAWIKQKLEKESSSIVNLESVSSSEVIAMVDKAVLAILTRLHNLAEFDNSDSKINILVSGAEDVQNICRMDPVWNPWL